MKHTYDGLCAECHGRMIREQEEKAQQKARRKQMRSAWWREEVLPPGIGAGILLGILIFSVGIGLILDDSNTIPDVVEKSAVFQDNGTIKLTADLIWDRTIWWNSAEIGKAFVRVGDWYHGDSFDKVSKRTGKALEAWLKKHQLEEAIKKEAKSCGSEKEEDF